MHATWATYLSAWVLIIFHVSFHQNANITHNINIKWFFVLCFLFLQVTTKWLPPGKVASNKNLKSNDQIFCAWDQGSVQNSIGPLESHELSKIKTCLVHNTAGCEIHMIGLNQSVAWKIICMFHGRKSIILNVHRYVFGFHASQFRLMKKLIFFDHAFNFKELMGLYSK